MESFSKLVQQKRSKMLILSLILSLTIFLKNNNGHVSATELKYIVRKEGNILLPTCIGEGNERYEGISWIFPLAQNENLPTEETYYLPSLKNDYNCKFSYNEHCSKIWSMKNWEIDTNTTRRFDYISDERWQDFPTYYVSNKTKDFSNRVEVPKIFDLGFSVRANEKIELFICEGWDPRKYSCYYFNVTKNEIILSKNQAMPDDNNNVQDKSHILDSYKAQTNIIFEDEWRNFRIGVDVNGKISLKDIILNRTVIEKNDKYPLRPAYFFFKSESPSLWKIHKNDFFYTKTPQISRLGPSLKLNTEDLCVNLYVTMCAKCTITFFIIENGTKTLIDQRQLRRGDEWSLIKLSREQVETDHLNIFVQTSLEKNARLEEAFWGIDDVRTCHKNEIRISLLKNNIDEDVFCQIVDKPQLRPIKKIDDRVQDYPTIESESDAFSINLTWTHENSNKGDIDYFITYQANDLCSDPPFNTKRTKSNGFVVTKSNKISLTNLIPYTTYNVAFSTMLHLKEKNLTLSTKESPYISLEEQINKIRIEEITDTKVRITWEKVDCRNIYGRIIYSLNLIEKSTGNVRNIGEQSDNIIVITELKPYTSYVLNITTSRGNKNETSGKFTSSVPLTTKPGLAAAPENLEIYSTSTTSISLRYDLPDKNEGDPIEVHITRCNPLTLKKCKSLQMPVIPCKMYEGKYCADVLNLIPNQKQMIRMSLKNDGSHTFGKEVMIEGFTEERVPGQPTNITYQLVDCSNSMEYCNLNISWLHPYEQNGTITSFEIFLRSSDNDSNIFQELYKTNLDYLPKYTYQIKYVPYSRSYDLKIRSVNNNLKSMYTTQTLVHTMDLGDQIDQSPSLRKVHQDSVEFDLKYDRRLKTTLTILVQDFDENREIDKKISEQIELVDNLCNEFGDTWISQVVKIDETTKSIEIGKSDQSGRSLKPETKYCVIFLMENEYHNSTHENVYYETLTTLPHIEETDSNGINVYLIVIACLIFLAIIGIFLFWCLRRRKIRSRRSRRTMNDDNENSYETLPFDDTIVNNNMYDRLRHK